MSVPTTLQGTHDECGGTVVFRPGMHRRQLLAGATVTLSAACRQCGATLTTQWALPGQVGAARAAWNVDAGEQQLGEARSMPIAAGGESWSGPSTGVGHTHAAPEAAVAQDTPEPSEVADLGEWRMRHPERGAATTPESLPGRPANDEYLAQFARRIEAARANLRRVSIELPTAVATSADAESGFRAPNLSRTPQMPEPALSPTPTALHATMPEASAPSSAAPATAPVAMPAAEPVAAQESVAIVEQPYATDAQDAPVSTEAGMHALAGMIASPSFHDDVAAAPATPAAAAPATAFPAPAQDVQAPAEPAPVAPAPAAAIPFAAAPVAAPQAAPAPQVAPTDADVFPPAAPAPVAGPIAPAGSFAEAFAEMSPMPTADTSAVAAGISFAAPPAAAPAREQIPPSPAMPVTPASASAAMPVVVDDEVAFEPTRGFDWGPDPEAETSAARIARTDADADASRAPRLRMGYVLEIGVVLMLVVVIGIAAMKIMTAEPAGTVLPASDATAGATLPADAATPPADAATGAAAAAGDAAKPAAGAKSTAAKSTTPKAPTPAASTPAPAGTTVADAPTTQGTGLEAAASNAQAAQVAGAAADTAAGAPTAEQSNPFARPE